MNQNNISGFSGFPQDQHQTLMDNTHHGNLNNSEVEEHGPSFPGGM